ncbi:MAG: LamG domain-containing protein [Methylococcaceae bacterium]|jgi:hypothetical protein
MAFDVDFNKVSLLLHCNGSNGSTTFIDSSIAAQILTNIGSTTISTAQAKFGGASVLIGTGKRLEFRCSRTSTGLTSATIEGWVYPTLIGGGTYKRYITAGAGSSSLCIRENAANRLEGVIFNSAGSLFFAGSTTAPTLNTWQHIALVFASGVAKLYKNGVLIGTSGAISGTIDLNDPTTGLVLIGAYSDGSEFFTGYLDEARVSNGVARYTANFTPQTEEFPNNGPQPTIGNISITGHQPILAHGFVAAPVIRQINLTGLNPKFSQFVFYGHPSQLQITLTGQQPGLILGFAPTPLQRTIALLGQQPTFVNRLFHAIDETFISTSYRCYLGDLELPISSFQTRMSTSTSYLSVVVKGIDVLIDEVTARLNQRISIFREYHYIDGSINRVFVLDMIFDTLQTSQGAHSGTTGILSGSENTPFVSPLTLELTDPITRSYDSGGIRYRCRIDPRVRPNDTVAINGETFQLEQVIHVIDAKTAIMEIKEKII